MSIHDKHHREEAWLWPRVVEGCDSRIDVGATGRLYRVDYTIGFASQRKRVGEADGLFHFDVRRSDREYWHRVKLFLEWLAKALPLGSRDWAITAYKQLRKYHHETKRREWDQVLPKPIVDWAWQVIERAQEGELCCDNARVAQLGNTGQMRRYKAAKAAGCCGFADFVETGPDGKRYLLGYNYGH